MKYYLLSFIVSKMVTTSFTTFTVPDIRQNSKKMIHWVVVLPYIIVPIFMCMGTINRELAFAIIVFIGMVALYINSRPRKKNRSPFFFSWTMASCLTMLLVFETGVIGELMITQLEHLALLVLIGCTAYFFYMMKAVADFVLAQGSSKEKEYSPVLTADSQYCQICQLEVNDRYFHSIWWDCCVFRPNYGHFLAGHIFGFGSLLYGTYLSLSTACLPYWDIKIDFNYCSEAYNEFWTSLDFSTSLYAVGYLLVIALVLIRQIVIYIPKYGVKNIFSGRKAKQQYLAVTQQDV